jgi:hypothetical protein
MAQQLEAALRRAPAPTPDPLAVTTKTAPGKNAPTRDFKARVEPNFESKSESKLELKTEPKFDIRPGPRVEPPATPGKNLYENLEEEMASLLGRPPGKT